jgi:hypothetical protein
MTQRINVRTLTVEEYERAECAFLASNGEPPAAPAPPAVLADKPDINCIDVRGLPPEDVARLEAQWLSENDQ